MELEIKINYEVTRIVKDGDKIGTLLRSCNILAAFLIALDPDPFWLFFHSVMFQIKAFFPTLKIHNKIWGFNQMKKDLRNLGQRDMKTFSGPKMFRGHRHLNFDFMWKRFRGIADI